MPLENIPEEEHEKNFLMLKRNARTYYGKRGDISVEKF